MPFITAAMILLLGIVLAAGAYAVVAFVFEFCWNNAMPAIFHLPEIGWFQAFCLLMIAHLLIRTKIEVNQKKDE